MGSLTSRLSWDLHREFQGSQGYVETRSQNKRKKKKRTGALLAPSSAEGGEGRARLQPFKLSARGDRPHSLRREGKSWVGRWGGPSCGAVTTMTLPATSPIRRLLPSLRPLHHLLLLRMGAGPSMLAPPTAIHHAPSPQLLQSTASFPPPPSLQESSRPGGAPDGCVRTRRALRPTFERSWPSRQKSLRAAANDVAVRTRARTGAAPSGRNTAWARLLARATCHSSRWPAAGSSR